MQTEKISTDQHVDTAQLLKYRVSLHHSEKTPALTWEKHLHLVLTRHEDQVMEAGLTLT